MQWFIYQTASCLTNRKELPRAVQNKKTFIGRRWQGEEVTSKDWIVSGMVTFLWGTAMVYPADYLTSGDQVIPDWLIKIPLLGEVETVIEWSFFF